MNPRHEQARTGQRRMAAACNYWQPHPAPHPEPPKAEIGAHSRSQAPHRGCHWAASRPHRQPRPDEAADTAARVYGPLAPQEASQ